MENNYTYEITDNGYFIFKNGKRYMTQLEPNIPIPNKNYEENALAQIEELKEAENSVRDEEDRLTNIELALAEIYESLEV